MDNTMKAIRIHSYGGNEVLSYEKATVPEIAGDELLVRVHGAGVNPIDWKVREGYAKDFLNYNLPLTLGWDVSGTVEATGAEVRLFSPGDEVFAFIDLSRGGGYAEFAAVKESEAAFKPRSLNHLQAAAVPLAALTAWQALFDIARISEGQRILIHAAAGGVGHFAVQLAGWRNAHTVCTASAHNHDFLREIGAHELIDYTKTPFETAIKDVDVVLDTMAGEIRARSWKVLKKGGLLVTTLPPAPTKEAEEHHVKAADILVRPSSKQLGEIAELIDSGHVCPALQETFPLEQAAQALDRSKAGHTCGKIVLRV
jgi:NADPH:quinone reductase-like Zn-dependent oxidoreductase